MPKIAVITGASSGIGLEIAKLAANDGYQLILAADTSFDEARQVVDAAPQPVDFVTCDLSTSDGVRHLLEAVDIDAIDVLVANAGVGTGGAFLDQEETQWRHSIDTNVTGTLMIIQPVLRSMVQRGRGRVLITGSIAGYVPGSFNAVYNATKAFIDNFSAAISNELKDSDVTITVLKPGATDTEFFERAGMQDTKVGQAKKDDPADVARTGWDAMHAGERSVVHGLKNKAEVLAAGVVSEAVTAQLHRKQAEPASD